MSKIMALYFSKNIDKYLHDLLKGQYKKVITIHEKEQLKKEVIISDKVVTILFIDELLLDDIKNYTDILENENFILIVVTREFKGNISNYSFIHDILELRNDELTMHFINRLKREVDSKLKLQSLEKEVSDYYIIGTELTAQNDIHKLLDLILVSAMDLTAAEAGSIYIVEDTETKNWSVYEKNNKNKQLRFMIAKNNRIKIDIQSSLVPISENSIYGQTIISGTPIRIEDAYNIPDDATYVFNSSFDSSLGYKTKSILSVPLKDHQNRILGVLQLINKNNDDNEIVSFSYKDESVILSLGSEAAISIENKLIYEKMEDLLEQYRKTISEEMTKRKLADEEINKLLSAIEHSPVTVVITDINGSIEYVNPKFTSLTGYSSNEVIGKNTKILNSSHHTKEFYQQFWNCILSGEEWFGEFRDKKKNGELYWVATSVSSLKDKNGKIKYFISVMEDVTEKKYLNQKIEEQNDQLRKTIKSLHEAQSQLVQKEKMAGIGQLAAGVAHEINNPLGFIISNHETLGKYLGKINQLINHYKTFMQLIEEDNIDKLSEQVELIKSYESDNHIDFLLGDLQGLFQETNDGLSRVKNIVKALRQFSHIDQMNEFTDYSLNEGILTTEIIINSKTKRDIVIEKKLGDIPMIKALGGDINQVLLNLMINAVYAIKAKENLIQGIIKIKTYYSNKMVICEISDNGEGIDKEVMDKIFEPFFTTKPIGKGSGLGLSIAYDVIVNKHKGVLEVDSTKGNGTKFIIKFPYDES